MKSSQLGSVQLKGVFLFLDFSFMHMLKRGTKALFSLGKMHTCPAWLSGRGPPVTGPPLLQCGTETHNRVCCPGIWFSQDWLVLVYSSSGIRLVSIAKTTVNTSVTKF